MFRRSAATLAAALRTRAVATSWTASSVLAAQARHYAPTRSFVSLVNKDSITTVGKTLAPALLSKRTYVSYPDDPVVADIKLEEIGNRGSADFRIQAVEQDQKVSLWHEVPLFLGPATIENSPFKTNNSLYLHYVNEVPKGTRAKFELATNEEDNPIRQDIVNGQPREFKYGDIPFNYGFLPQTWEDSSKLDFTTNLPGDNDPLDVIDISSVPMAVGEVGVARLLGAMCLVDEGVTDWKIIVCNVNDPRADECQSVAAAYFEDIFGNEIVDNIRDWFTNYKTVEGKQPNTWGYEGRALGEEFARNIVEDCYHDWRTLSFIQNRSKTPAIDSLWLSHTNDVMKQIAKDFGLQANPADDQPVLTPTMFPGLADSKMVWPSNDGDVTAIAPEQPVQVEANTVEKIPDPDGLNVWDDFEDEYYSEDENTEMTPEQKKMSELLNKVRPHYIDSELGPIRYREVVQFAEDEEYEWIGEDDPRFDPKGPWEMRAINPEAAKAEGDKLAAAIRSPAIADRFADEDDVIRQPPAFCTAVPDENGEVEVIEEYTPEQEEQDFDEIYGPGK